MNAMMKNEFQMEFMDGIVMDDDVNPKKILQDILLQCSLLEEGSELASLKTNMKACWQTQGLSTYQHGVDVAERLAILLQYLHDGTPVHDFILPCWLDDLRERWAVPGNFQAIPGWPLRDACRILFWYAIFHDAGKYLCLEKDEEGRSHFPNHAMASAKIWRETHKGNLLTKEEDEIIAQLIERDLDFHILKSQDIPEFAASPLAIPLMLSGLAAIQANCQMFGGQESTSYKIKWKHTNKRGRQILSRQ